MTTATDNPRAAAPSLSICIPTYNFGRYIVEALASIVPQLRSDCEIVILDGGSTDNTTEVVAAAQADCDWIRYYRQEKRGGIDADIARVVSLAAGEYCWLFSADDVMEPGAIDRVFSAIVEKPSVVIVAHSDCTLDMEPIAPIHGVLCGGSRAFTVSDVRSREAYFACAETSEAFFSFLSGLIVRRAYWRPERPVAEYHERSCWSHAARLLTRMRDEGMTIAYIADPLVARRGDNDSFRERGLVARIALAIDGYTHIVRDTFGPAAPELAHLRRALRAEFKFGTLFHAKQLARGDRAARLELSRLAAEIWSDSPVQRLRVAALRLLPPGVAFGLHRATLIIRAS